MSLPSQPTTPAEWLRYSQSEIVTSIPLREEHKTDENTIIERAVYLDESKIESPTDQLLYLYTDVFAFTKPEVTISPEAYAEIQIIARVLTAGTPVSLKVVPNTGYHIYIYASIIDQPISVSLSCNDSSEPLLLKLGPSTGNVGVRLSAFPDHIFPEYQTAYVRAVDVDLQASLNTQLRVALALFWGNTALAISLCSYVASVTSNPALSDYSKINAQAGALGQQLAAQAMTGPDMGYAPVLQVDQYLSTVHDALDAVSAFEEQYQRFQDNEQDVENLKLAWSSLLDHARTQLSQDTILSAAAWTKYQDACTVVARCQEQLNIDNREVDNAKSAFQKGLEAWAARTISVAAYETLSAILSTYTRSFPLMLPTDKCILEFTNAIGVLILGFQSSLGDAAKDIKGAVDDVKKVEKGLDQTGKTIPSTTLESLGDCMQALESLYPGTADLAAAVKKLESDPSAVIPSSAIVTGSSDGDADARAIITLAAWDKWALDVENQLAYAVGQSISGASAYRLALRKQAVDGKALAQAQAEAVKAGHEYIQAAIEVIVCNHDIDTLKHLLDTYTEEKEQYVQAEAKFFDRVLDIRTSLVLQMQKLVWAYKYRALADSSVVLDSQKSIEEFKADLLTLDSEIQAADERYATDFQPFEYKQPSSELPANYGDLMIQGLQGESHSASFTLAPTTDASDKNSFASIFNNGSHFRLEGLEMFLQGVVPRPEAISNGVAQVIIDILTSGVYADIQNGKIFHFTSLARQVRLTYEISDTGAIGDTLVHAIFPTGEHAEPTPFTQWTIKLQNPDELDLTKLSGVELHWNGNARFLGKLSAPTSSTC
ncbi:hypothetical protein ASPBRDRAFT_66094 [Aspergillus brasiliensis CBS 101740]|uniref:Uncharacterized protein n=1 Tax=Aspergillus brasiliensis (strain CBS 101740 / IMI 381727 / IBT 21946) TaxID=767769 RepID=A0A1L9UHA4_ASPBC|nr:hypothetical protein ASPBRDRAFT_66094 [Aspergillus brasiliensis CBS 101740]